MNIFEHFYEAEKKLYCLDCTYPKGK